MDHVHLCTLTSLLFITIAVDASNDNLTKYYVIPTNGNTTLCQQSVTLKCLTFNQYTNHQDQYFHSNSTFIFQLGIHQLNASLSLSNVQNISFRGESLSTSTGGRSVIVYLNPQVSLSWTNCDQIEIRSLNFVSFGNYDHRLMFINALDILLSNISIIGNGCSDGCSAIDCQSSTVSISNSTLAGIHGEFSGVFVLNSSRIIFNGANILINNKTNFGGGIYATNSEIQMSGEVNLSMECDLSCRSFCQNREEDKTIKTLCTFKNSKINVFSSLAAKNYIRFCNGSSINTRESELLNIAKEVIPGQTFNFTITIIGQGITFVRGIVVSMNANSSAKYRLSPAIQTISDSPSCKTFDYRLHVTGGKPNNDLVSCRLFLDGPCIYQSLADGIEMRLNILPCPVGFTLDSKKGECVCDEWLQPLTQDCFIDSQSILRSRNNFWVGMNQTLNCAEDDFILLYKGSCPFDYCVDCPVNVTLRLDDQAADVQCHEGRGGVLCSTCKENYSLALGSLNCLPNCSNAYLALLIPFALLGVIVVITLFLLHLTVAAGTINGLILYANIVQANYRAFFPVPSPINYFSMVFIAWLNFDFGIETCLYDGLTIYSYSWLEFLFPLYLWILIIIIIVASHYSQRISNSLGHNAVAVLDTILFMSYSKILKATIVPLTLVSISVIRFPTNTTVTMECNVIRVWLYDPNIIQPFFQEPYHIALGVFAIFILLLLIFPYTFLLLCGHWLQAKSRWSILSWINKLKPFMDAYHAPYKMNKRHWIGVYLLARCGLYVLFAIKFFSDYDNINLLVTFSVIAGLSITKGYVYEKRYNDFLESSFILNLCILSIATFYVSKEVVDPDSQSMIQNILSNISVGIAFVYFVGILIFHMYKRLESVGMLKNNCFYKSADNELARDTRTDTNITNSSINLRELLLDETF